MQRLFGKHPDPSEAGYGSETVVIRTSRLRNLR